MPHGRAAHASVNSDTATGGRPQLFFFCKPTDGREPAAKNAAKPPRNLRPSREKSFKSEQYHRHYPRRSVFCNECFLTPDDSRLLGRIQIKTSAFACRRVLTDRKFNHSTINHYCRNSREGACSVFTVNYDDLNTSLRCIRRVFVCSLQDSQVKSSQVAFN